MNENNTIKKMVSGILRGRKNASFDRYIMHPEREWFIAAFIGITLFSVGIAWNVSTHLQFTNVAVLSAPEAEEAVVYRASLVESALADFEIRRQQYEELKRGLLERQVVAPVVVEIESATTTPEASGGSEVLEESTSSDASTDLPEASVVLPPPAVEDEVSVLDQQVI
jgi:hypothetical protein